MPSIDIPIGHHDEMEAECLMERFRLRHGRNRVATTWLRRAALHVQGRRHYGRRPVLMVQNTRRLSLEGFRIMSKGVLLLSRSQRRDYITIYYRFEFDDTSDAVMFKMKLDYDDQP